MLSHGAIELTALADLCDLDNLGQVNGWQTELWSMDEASVTAAVAAYEALLVGSVESGDPVAAALEEAGIDVLALLVGSDDTVDRVTRSDLTELVAAATMIAVDDCTPEQMHMPNVPKMSRKKSDSGVDVFYVFLDPNSPQDDLQPDDRLLIASVKHTIGASMSGLRGKLVESMVGDELTKPYLTRQLRVLEGRLRQEGVDMQVARRVYLFLRDFPDSDFVRLIGVGIAAPEHETNLIAQVESLPATSAQKPTFRMVTLPGLATIHERCP